METKKEIRRISLEKRKKLPVDIRREYSHRITERVLGHPFFQCADIVLCYVAFREEVDTEEIIHHAWKMGKTVAVPKVHGKNDMEFYEIRSMSDLKSGYQGILEPDSEHLRKIQKKDIDARKRALMLLPGAAFDPFGHRIGYGGGFYDAYLQKYPYFHKIGLAFSVQCVEGIPAEEHDISVDMVITELGEYGRR